MRSLLLISSLTSLLASCSDMQPDGTLKKVVDGQLFQPGDSAAVRQDEDKQREDQRLIPRTAVDDEPLKLRMSL